MKKLMKYSFWCFMLLLASCQDFLEPQSQSEYVPKLVQSLQELLLGSVYMGPGDGAITNKLCYFDDDVEQRSGLTGIDPSSENDFFQIGLAFSWSDEMQLRLSGYNIYGMLYDKIVGCNAVLDYMDDVKGSKEEKDYVTAQALTMRAFYYYYLVNLYGKPYNVDKNAMGVPLKVTSNLSMESLPRNTVKEVYDQMERDLLESERLFKTLPVERQFKREGLVNLPVVQLLLSRIYLYMENWQEAEKYGDKVINDHNISFKDLTADAFGGKGRSAKKGEYAAFYSWENPEVIFLFGDAYAAHEFAIREAKFKDEKGRYSFKTLGVASADLLKRYGPGDLRIDTYLEWERTYGEIPVYRLATGKVDFNNFRGGQAWGGALRLSEAYLNVAEAAAMLYKTGGEVSYLTKAKDLLDRLREKRIAPYQKLDVTNPELSNADSLLDFVREERRRELCFESHRWFDLRRYGMDEITHTWYDNSGAKIEYKLEKNDLGFTLLIPQEAFKLNHDLVQNEKRGK